MSEQPNPSCSGCGGPHPFDTTVPSVIWNAVVRMNHLPDYLCLTCIVAAFVRAGQSFTANLIGGGFHGAPIEIRVNGIVAQDAARVSEENTRLRSVLFAKEAHIEALEIEAATWRALAGPMWVGDESEGHWVCLACNQAGADDGGCKTIQHLPDCKYAATLAKEKTP